MSVFTHEEDLEYLASNPIGRLEALEKFKRPLSHYFVTDDTDCANCEHVYHWHFERDKLPSGRTGCGHPSCECEVFQSKKFHLEVVGG